jgi:hypothetical protein
MLRGCAKLNPSAISPMEPGFPGSHALKIIELTHDLIAKPLTLRPIMG